MNPRKLTEETVESVIEQIYKDYGPWNTGVVREVVIYREGDNNFSVTLNRHTIFQDTIRQIGQLFGDENILVVRDFDCFKLIIAYNPELWQE